MRIRRQMRNFVFFNVPALVIYTVFWIVPILLNLIVSFSTWNGVTHVSRIKWVLFRNYFNIFTDEMFYKVISHNFALLLVNVLFIPTVAFFAALCIEKGIKYKGFFRTALFIPVTLPMLLVAILFRWVYSIDNGMINAFLGFIGLKALQTDFLGNMQTALVAVAFMGIWKQMPFHMTIILAGLQSVPADLEEAALIDGCNEVQSVWHVTIPVLRPVLTVVYGLVVIDAFRVFDLVFVSTLGGPGNSTAVISTYIYNVAFKDMRLGYSTALSTINVLIVLLISIVYFHFSMKSNTDSGKVK
jgi:raffinose/stachyose/melibiose transport system permease protein